MHELHALVRKLRDDGEDVKGFREFARRVPNLTTVLESKNSKGANIFHACAKYGKVQALLYILLDLRMDINDVDARGRSALHYACEYGRFEACTVLLQQSASTAIQCLETGDTPLHFFVALPEPDSREEMYYYKLALELLIQNSEDIRLCDVKGCTSLHRAAERGNARAVRALLKKDPTMARVVSLNGESLLHAAARGFSDRVFKYVLRALGDFSPLLRCRTAKYGNAGDVAQKMYKEALKRSARKTKELENLLVSNYKTITLALLQSIPNSTACAKAIPSAVQFFRWHGLLLDIVLQAVSWEVDQIDSETLFLRGHSSASVLLSEFCRLEAATYLQVTLGASLKRLQKDGAKFCLKPGTHVSTIEEKERIQQLQSASEVVLKRIFASGHNLPLSIKQLLAHIEKVGRNKFDTGAERLLAGVVFLRLICPAIVSPVKYGLLSNCSPELTRSFVAICKVLQHLANGSTFKKSEGNPLQELNQFLEAYTNQVSFFFEQCLFDMDMFVSSAELSDSGTNPCPSPALSLSETSEGKSSLKGSGGSHTSLSSSSPHRSRSPGPKNGGSSIRDAAGGGGSWIGIKADPRVLLCMESLCEYIQLAGKTVHLDQNEEGECILKTSEKESTGKEKAPDKGKGAKKEDLVQDEVVDWQRLVALSDEFVISVRCTAIALQAPKPGKRKTGKGGAAVEKISSQGKSGKNLRPRRDTAPEPRNSEKGKEASGKSSRGRSDAKKKEKDALSASPSKGKRLVQSHNQRSSSAFRRRDRRLKPNHGGEELNSLDRSFEDDKNSPNISRKRLGNSSPVPARSSNLFSRLGVSSSVLGSRRRRKRAESAKLVAYSEKKEHDGEETGKSSSTNLRVVNDTRRCKTPNP